VWRFGAGCLTRSCKANIGERGIDFVTTVTAVVKIRTILTLFANLFLQLTENNDTKTQAMIN